MIQQTTCLKKLCKFFSDEKGKHNMICCGGAGAGKTFNILIILINHCLTNPNIDCYVVSHQLSKLRYTCIKDFKNILQEFGVYKADSFKGSIDYIFDNGSHIRFLGLDKDDTAKGLRADIVFLEEADKIPYENARQIISRSKKNILAYNPSQSSYIDKILIPREDSAFIRLTYNDNEFISDEEKAEILSYRTLGYNDDGTIKNALYANLWQVYGEGKQGVALGQIYTNYEEGDFIELDQHCYGLDFGFSNDPDAMIEMSIDRKSKTMYIRELLYVTGLSTEELATAIKAKIGQTRTPIICDSAAPRTIADLRSKGLNTIGAVKNKVVDDIKEICGWKMIVDPNSLNLLEELRNYVWKENSIIPIDSFNHCLDCQRYAFRYLTKPVVRPASLL